jgi:hypothetical protein
MTALRVLVGAQLRAAPSGVLAAAAVAGAVAVLALGSGPEAPRTVAALQLAAVALASGLALLLGDPAAVITGAAPVPLWLRRVAILIVALPAAAVTWLLLLGLAGVGGEWPLTLTLELAALAGLGLAVAARRPALAPAALTVALAAVAIVWPDRLSPSAGEHRVTRLAAAAIAAATLAAYAHGSRDPLRR